jgi:hypothetical protein
VFIWMILPIGFKAIGAKFCYRLKRREDGSIDKHKARIVAKGFEQTLGIDYPNTTAPVAGVTSFRMLVIIALIKGWDTYSWDVEAAFLHGVLKEEIYMKPPNGFTSKEGTGKVLKLLKTIYGLKQAAHEWWKLLSQTFIDLKYQPVDSSSCFWIKEKDGQTCIVCHHVDDCAVTASHKEIAFELRDTLKSRYGITDGGALSWHLGMAIDIKHGSHASIHQTGYIKSIMARFGMTNATPVTTPMLDSTRIRITDCPEVVDEELKQEYMEIVGSLNYLSYCSRYDIAYACSQLGTVLAKPGPSHLVAAKRVIRYLAGTMELGLVYRLDPWHPPGFDHIVKSNQLLAYSDADWAGDKDSRLSTTSYVTFLAGGPISWKAKKQKVHAGSSAESELIAMSGGAKDIIYIR